MFGFLFRPQKRIFHASIEFIEKHFKGFTAPAISRPLRGALADIPRSKAQLLTENALLRQQLLVLNRQIPNPTFQPLDRLFLVFLARLVKGWRQVLVIVKPDTLLKWHRAGFKLLWKHKSKPKSQEPKISQETIDLIKKLAAENPLWGAERIRGELLKLEIKVAKRTIQRYMRQAKPVGSPSQSWRTFLKNHASQIWSCDFLPVTDIFFRQLYAFVIMEESSRKIVHVGVTTHPTDEWTAQQLREATPFEERPKYLIRDNDTKFGPHFQQIAQGAGIRGLKTPVRAPNANARCERLMGTLRRELLDHFLIMSERYLRRVLKEYQEYYNRKRPHQGIGQSLPVIEAAKPETGGEGKEKGRVVAFPVLGGLHYHYQRVA